MNTTERIPARAAAAELALRAGLLQYPAVEKALENLDAATRGDRRPHADLLPIFLPDNENH